MNMSDLSKIDLRDLFALKSDLLISADLVRNKSVKGRLVEHAGLISRLIAERVSEKPATQPAAGEPVAYEFLPRRIPGAVEPEWERCSKERFEQYQEYHRQYGGQPPVRALYAAPPAAAPVAVGEPAKYWAFHNEFGELGIEDRWDVAKHLPFDLIPLITPPAAAHGDEAVRKDAERLDFILTKCRKVVVEMLPRGRDVYVEEGVMGERTYPAVHHDKDWPAGSAEDFAVKRRAIDAAMRVQGDGEVQ